MEMKKLKQNSAVQGTGFFFKILIDFRKLVIRTRVLSASFLLYKSVIYYILLNSYHVHCRCIFVISLCRNPKYRKKKIQHFRRRLSYHGDDSLEIGAPQGWTAMEIHRCVLLCHHSTDYNRLWALDTQHHMGQIIHHVLCHYRNSVGIGYVPEYWRKGQ